MSEESPLSILRNLLSDPKNNGDYELNIKGEELNRLWRAIEQLESSILRVDNE